ncbi:MAG: lytic transglycosylase domain-containing protein [Firmicutes bacterium]|nr:lytic transglycosylase domain-containing protein [Bacillota bacterium]
MKRLTADIANEVSQIEVAKEAVEQQHAELTAAKERIDILFQTIVSQKKQLQDEIARQRELYDQIQEERRKLAQTESELRISSRIVAGQIIALQTGGTTRAVGPTPELKALATSIADKYGIPPNLFIALIWQESGWNYRAVSLVGAIGLTQVMPFNIVAWGYDIETFRNSPSQQLEAGAWYLSQQYKKFGRWDLALAAYNAGPGAVIKYGGIPPYPETQRYVRNILAMAGM